MNRLSIIVTLAWLLVLAPAARMAPAADWVEYLDVSDTRIVADEGAPDPVGLTDEFEKDLISGDVDHDGDLDLVVVRKVRFSNPGGKRNVLFMNQSGTFVDRTADFIPDFLDLTDDRDVALVDVDGDTWLDVVTATTFDHQPRVYMNLGLDGSQVWLGFAYDLLDNRIPPFSPAPKFCAVAAGDVDNDLDVDLFFVDYSNTLEDRLLINDGDGFFTDETTSRLTAAMSESAFGTDGQIEDMNGDGFNDIIKISTLGGDPNSVRILYNNPADPGFFDDFLPMHHAYIGAPYMMEVADLNNDLRPDIYVVDDGQDRYLLNTGPDAQGTSTFTTMTVTGRSPIPSAATSSWRTSTVTAIVTSCSPTSTPISSFAIASRSRSRTRVTPQTLRSSIHWPASSRSGCPPELSTSRCSTPTATGCSTCGREPAPATAYFSALARWSSPTASSRVTPPPGLLWCLDRANAR